MRLPSNIGPGWRPPTRVLGAKRWAGTCGRAGGCGSLDGCIRGPGLADMAEKPRDAPARLATNSCLFPLPGRLEAAVWRPTDHVCVNWPGARDAVAAWNEATAAAERCPARAGRAHDGLMPAIGRAAMRAAPPISPPPDGSRVGGAGAAGRTAAGRTAAGRTAAAGTGRMA